jgi:hypothetical protein
VISEQTVTPRFQGRSGETGIMERWNDGMLNGLVQRSLFQYSIVPIFHCFFSRENLKWNPH